MQVFLRAQSLLGNGLIGLVTLALMVLAADFAVSRLVRLANYFGLSTTFVGMTVVSLATSIPEITAHLTASVGILTGTLDYEIGSAIVLGANIGSDVVQQTLILGTVVLVAGSLYFRRYFLWKSMLPMIAVHALALVLGWDGFYSRIDGAILVIGFIGYTYFLYLDERKHYDHTTSDIDEDEMPATGREAALDGVFTLGAMLVTVICASVVLEITEITVQMTGIGGSFLGVVTLGVASALPELTTALSGIGRGEHGISLGTLVGSNITNPLVAIGSGALVSTYAAPRGLLYWDLPWAVISGCLLWAWLWWRGGRIKRPGAIYLITIYAIYVGMRALLFLTD